MKKIYQEELAARSRKSEINFRFKIRVFYMKQLYFLLVGTFIFSLSAVKKKNESAPELKRASLRRYKTLRTSKRREQKKRDLKKMIREAPLNLHRTEMMWIRDIVSGVSTQSVFFRDKLDEWQIKGRKEWLTDSVKKEILREKEATLEGLIKNLKIENKNWEQDLKDVKEILGLSD